MNYCQLNDYLIPLFFSCGWLFCFTVFWLVNLVLVKFKCIAMSDDARFDRWLKKTTNGSCFDYSFLYMLTFGSFFLLSITSLIYSISAFQCWSADLSAPNLTFLSAFLSDEQAQNLSWLNIFGTLAIPFYPGIFLFAHTKFASKYSQLCRTHDALMQKQIDYFSKETEGQDNEKALKYLQMWKASFIEDIYICRLESHPQFMALIEGTLQNDSEIKAKIVQLQTYKTNLGFRRFIDSIIEKASEEISKTQEGFVPVKQPPKQSFRKSLSRASVYFLKGFKTAS